MKIRDASVTVRPTWVTIEDMDFPRLAKLSLPGIKEGLKHFQKYNSYLSHYGLY